MKTSSGSGVRRTRGAGRVRVSRTGRAAVAALALMATGCATVPAGQQSTVPTRSDPFEPMNRSIFAFNDAIDRTVLRPMAKAYVDILHPGIRQMVGNVFANLGDLWTSVNQLLQGKPDLAAADLGRFAINTIIGFGGIADVASEMGIDRHKEDFGQTLGRWGVPSGPYVVLPIFGPSSLRDAPAFGLDLVADPLWRIAENGTYYGASVARVVDGRAGLLGADRMLDGAALDRYAFIRDGYLQRRRSLIWDGTPPAQVDDDPLPPADPRQGNEGGIDSVGRVPLPSGFRVR
jgi:phospholipid-binding lipoprotein MlaA